MDDDGFLKVGELARRTGVSVRTLHHYHEIGLLEPALGGSGEHRLYGPREIARLQQIRALARLRMSLAEIRSCLDAQGAEPLSVVERLLERLEQEMALARRLRDRLEAIAESLRKAEEPSVEIFLQAIELMSEMDRVMKYYTGEQQEYLAQRREEVGDARIREVQDEWQALFEDYRAALERGADPASAEVLALARKSKALIAEFTGGDPGIHASLSRMYSENPDMPQQWGVEPELWRYMGEASSALEGEAGGG